MSKPPRYIDVNLLQERLEQVSREPDYMHEGETWDVGVFLAGTIADCIPTADVREERYGQWEKFGYKWKCSACNSKVNVDGTPFDNNLFYCSRCGAKMAQEEE